ncbi:unnamed protein product [Mucor hiemalis]
MLKFKKHENDKEKKESNKKEDSGSRSPPRRSRDHSPPRRSRDYSPPRRSRDYSPPRRNREDRSPRRGGGGGGDRYDRYNEARGRQRSRSPKRRYRSPPKEKVRPSEKAGIKKVLKAQPTYSLIELEVNDRLGKKVRVKCAPNDLVGDFKKLVAAQIGTEPSKIVLKKWYKEFKDHITLADYELHDGMNIELYYR